MSNGKLYVMTRYRVTSSLCHGLLHIKYRYCHIRVLILIVPAYVNKIGHYSLLTRRHVNLVGTCIDPEHILHKHVLKKMYTPFYLLFYWAK